MDHKKVEQLQQLLELTTEYINELVLTSEMNEISSVDLFQEAVSQAIDQYHFVTRKSTKRLPIGKVDINILAFSLLDNETMAILRGPADLLDGMEFDTLGGEEPSHDDED